ncbi:hypothetical protein Vafri_9563 [Volvox africanus]|uniref:Uncharacterized protein n=1 Tax=Volvox africanus TaxID=51714 RepID=A0A8J4EZ20_9CHLO|nr:hypothetical protein Vafri_9563 [Volvox africanus]
MGDAVMSARGKLLRASYLLTCCLKLVLMARGSDIDDPKKLLRSCWNELYDPDPIGFTDWISGRPARLYLVDVWTSPAGKSTLPLTIFTMASLDRLPMLESQCRGYEGPISAAIYLPLLTERNEGGSGNGGDDARMGVEDNGALSNSWRLQQLGSYPHDIGYGDEKPSLTAGAAIAATLDELMLKEHGDKIRSAREMVQALSSRVEALRFNGVPMCELTLMLFAERTADSQIAAIMPTNALRNAAGVAVRTALAAMLDADLGVSSSFNSMIKNASWIEYLMEETHASPPALCVLPAYEANPQLDDVTANRISDLALAGSKLDLIALWANATVKVFHVDGCRSCHRPINHVLWTRTQVPYEVDFHRNFEPWGILSRFQDPGYDEVSKPKRFREGMVLVS